MKFENVQSATVDRLLIICIGCTLRSYKVATNASGWREGERDREMRTDNIADKYAEYC